MNEREILLKFLDLIHNECLNVNCSNCALYAFKAGRLCIFDKMPFYWNKNEIETAVDKILKVGENNA